MKVNRSYWFKLVTCDLEHPIIGSALFQHIIALQRSFVLDFRPNNPGHWFLFLFAFVCWVKLDFLSQARAKGHRIGLNITELRKKNCYTKLEFVYDIQSPWHSSNTSALFVFAASYFKLFSPVASEAVECQQFIPFVPTDTRQFFLLSQHATSVGVVDGLQLPKPHLEQVFKKFFSMAHSHVVCFVLLNQF